MKMKPKIYIFLFLLCFESCKTENIICTSPDTPASFGNSATMFPAYIAKSNIDNFEIYKFNYELTIEKNGKVIEVISHNKECRTDSLMRDYLLKMPNWNPAIRDGKKVKSVYQLKFHIDPQ